MRAVVVERPGVLVVKDVPKPSIGEHDILLRVRSASICNATDNHILFGEFAGYHDHYPQILGHEVCGEVVQVGASVEGVRVGERIVTYTPHGAFCEYTKVRARSAWARVPDSIDDEVASLCEMFHGALITTAFTTGVRDGEQAIVIGAGPMGLVLLQTLKSLADVRVGVIDRIETRLRTARLMGADFTYNNNTLNESETAALVAEDFGYGADLVCVCTATDASPGQTLYDFAATLLRRGGRLTGLSVDVKGLTHHVGVYQLFERQLHLARTLYPERPSQSPGCTTEHQVFQMGVDWVAAGAVNLKDLITDRVDLDHIEEGLRLCRERPDRTIKVAVRVDTQEPPSV